jgi:hypothetical protein
MSHIMRSKWLQRLYRLKGSQASKGEWRLIDFQIQMEERDSSETDKQMPWVEKDRSKFQRLRGDKKSYGKIPLLQ